MMCKDLILNANHTPTTLEQVQETLKITDPLYGTFDIVEPVLIHLINSKTVQRLNHVYQHGITDLIGLTAPVSRFEHSVGAMLLVRLLGCSLEEQIAG